MSQVTNSMVKTQEQLEEIAKEMNRYLYESADNHAEFVSKFSYVKNLIASDVEAQAIGNTLIRKIKYQELVAEIYNSYPDQALKDEDKKNHIIKPISSESTLIEQITYYENVLYKIVPQNNYQPNPERLNALPQENNIELSSSEKMKYISSYSSVTPVKILISDFEFKKTLADITCITYNPPFYTLSPNVTELASYFESLSNENEITCIDSEPTLQLDHNKTTHCLKD